MHHRTTRNTLLMLLAGALIIASAACEFKRSQHERRDELAMVDPVGPTVRLAPPPHEALRLRGEGLFFGRAGCAACHKVGVRGTAIKGPNLGVGDGMTESIAVRGGKRIGNLSAIEYIVSSIVDPDAYIVKGYVRGIMKKLDQPPTSLTDAEIVAIAAYLAGQDRPITDADLDRAHDRIELARRFREQRRKLPGKRKP